MIRFLYFIIFIICGVNSYGQIVGHITSSIGDTLPYATIYIENTSTGTVSNVEGFYELALEENGTYNLIFQYVGYKKQSLKITYTGKKQNHNIALEPDDNIVTELTISANREDPAYAIIRKAIQKRSYYKNQVNSFEADLYVKGSVKITDAPEAVFGQDIGDMGGVLDTSRQGIIYLSESKSKYYFTKPNKTKEVMLSSVTSGENSLFTANQFSMFSFDMYDEYMSFGRSIVSPIADNALSHYNYILEKTTIDSDGLTINKIKVIPKSNNAPLLRGHIYIVENLWNIQSLDVQFYGNSLKSSFLDTINLRQIFVPVKKPDTWRLFSQVIDFKAGVFGFKMGGVFSYIFSKYEIEKDLSNIFVNNEKFRVEQSALNKDTAFWKSERPIPLTMEEERDYIRKDSLSRIWNSKSYMDSVDRVGNKFKFLNLLMGYTWNNSYENRSISFPSPISSIRFNAVEGYKLNLAAKWQWSDSTYRNLSIFPNIEYGFSDKILKPWLEMEYRFDNPTLGHLHVSGGRRNQQFDDNEPITERNNTWRSLMYKLNGIRLFQNNFVKAGYRQEISNGIYIDFSTEYAHRKPLVNTTNYSFRKKDLVYEENIPRADFGPEYYAENKYIRNHLNLLLRPFQRYSSYPNVKVRDVSDWPNIEIDYTMGMALDDNASSFNKLSFRLRDRYVRAKLLGYFSYNVEYGTFLGRSPSFFGDFFHPIGNESYIPISPDLASFNLMPYYSYSSNRYYGLVNFRHHFNGYIIDKIPLLNKTSLKMIVAASAMYEPTNGEYIELAVGLENFKIGPVPIFDVDYTWAFDKSGFRTHGITFRLSEIFNR